MPAADVDRHDRAHAPGLDDLLEELDVAVGRGAEHHARRAGAQGVADVHERPQPASVLHGHVELGRDPSQVLDVVVGRVCIAADVGAVGNDPIEIDVGED